MERARAYSGRPTFAVLSHMTLISTPDDLSAVCRRLATHTFVTVDTEFLRDTTFWPRL